jgi:hypothetical protein
LYGFQVFGMTVSLDEQYPELVKQANLILKKCQGVPLAIVTVGLLLANQPKTVLEWSKLSESMNSELEMNQELQTIISKVYDGLPYHLKSCLMYLPIFPEDYKVRQRRLVRRWTAEGYAREVGDKSAEETSNTYFMELISRSMIVPCQSSFDSREGNDSCQVDNIISEISISKSREGNSLVFKLEEGCSQNTQP